ncbi:deoxyribonuclease-1-like 2 isoform X1 [Ursus americanus]|uniref:deoxyribonuclease-1-like 2 isoform X1 n=1 Tax=Ursus americanus TaxID=9643 RepID=UPI001E67BDD2|nr:deoxyribonuclease-1-like 2 isoform X1 [Ursus americanus]
MGGPRVLLAALWALGAAGAAALRVGAFNIQSFGDSKVSDPACGGVIAQILAGYDITLVQEVRDPDLSAVSALMEQINSVSRHEYSFVSSEPLGRDQYKEMYLFVYRKDAVSVVDTYQYPDLEDAFSREPFVVKFSAPGSAAGEFVLIPLHAAPHRAVSEIDALYDVYLDVIDKWGTDVSPVPVPVPCARAGGWRCPCGRGVRGRARAQPRLRGPRRTCCSWATSTLTATTCGSATGRLSACAAARSSSGSSPTALTPPWATRTAPTTASWRAAPACAGASSPSRPPCTTSRRSSAWTRLRLSPSVIIFLWR